MAREWMPQDTRYFLQLLIERDGKRCYYCGDEVYLVEEIPLKPKSTRERQLANARRQKRTTVDHRIPVSQGGDEFDTTNMVIACYACNQQKGTRFPRKFEKDKKRAK